MKVMGDGSITRLEKKPYSKCRKWRLRVQTDQGEKPRRFNGTHSQAKEALARFIAELETPASNMGSAEYFAQYLSSRELSGDYEANTIDKDRQQIRLLCGEFGGDLLHEIDKGRAQDGLLAIKNGNNPSKRVLSGTYMNGVHAKMKAIMEDA